MASTNPGSGAGFGQNEQQNTSGLSGREPISGSTGAGTANEPYDSGNADSNPNLGGSAGPEFTHSSGSHDPEGRREDGAYGGSTFGSDNPNARSTSSTTGQQHGSTTATDPSSTHLGGQSDTRTGASGAQGRNIAGDIRPEHDTEKTGVTGIHSDDTKYSDQKLSSSNAPGGSGTVGGFGGADSSVGADPTSGQDYKQKQQGADRPGEEPTGESAGAVRNTKNLADDVAGKDTGRHGASHLSGSTGHSTRTGEQEESSNKSKGTGETWVKTSGFAADGGDFDATKPGAGKEADRLLAQKGIQRSLPGKPDSGENAPQGPGSSGKPSVAEKIKDRLHVGGHSG